MDSKRILLLFLILGIAMFFRFFLISQIPPGLYPDEAMNGSNAQETIQNGGPLSAGKAFYPENNGREGLFINIQAFFLEILIPDGKTPEPWMLRIPSALFGVLTVFAVFLLARELFRGEGEKKATAIGLIAAFFLATSFWHVNFSRIGFRAIMSPLFLSLGIWLLLLAFRKSSSWFIPLLGGIAYGLGFHSYIAYRATPLLLAIVAILFLRELGWKRLLKTLAIFAAGVILASLPLVVYFAANPGDFFGRTAQVSVFSSPSPLLDLLKNCVLTFGMFFFRGDGNWRHNISGAPELFLPVAILFAVGLAAAAMSLKKTGKTSHTAGWVLLSWLAIAAAPVVISNEGIPHALRAILMIPPVMILAAWATMEIHGWLKKKNIHPRPCQILASLFFLSVAANSYYAYFILWGENREVRGAFAEDYVKTAKAVNSLPAHIPKYIVVDAGGTLVRGTPMPAQTVMFLTDSFTENKRKEKNIRYVNPDERVQFPDSAAIFILR